MFKKNKRKKWFILSSILSASLLATPLIATACAKRLNEVSKTEFYVDKNQKYFIHLLVEINSDQSFDSLKQKLENTRFEIFTYDSKVSKTSKNIDIKPIIEKEEKNFNDKKMIGLFLILDEKPTTDKEYVVVANANVKSIKLTTINPDNFNIVISQEVIG